MQSGQHSWLSFIFRFGKRILRPHEILGKQFWPNSEKSEGETDFPGGNAKKKKCGFLVPSWGIR
jgi:hypothetical protein